MFGLRIAQRRIDVAARGLVASLILIAFDELPATSEPTADDPAVVETTPVDGYRGIWYANQPSGDEYAYKYSGGLGVYCAKHNPFAAYCPKAEKTFFCYGGATADSFTRLVHMVSYYDHRTGQVPRPRLLLDKQTGDAHDNPVISVDDAGHIWIFSTSHGRSRPSYIHRSVRPYDIEEFQRIDAVYEAGGKQKPLDNFSYLQVWRTPKYGFTAFFTRYGDPAPRTSMFMTSRDGRRWSRERVAAIEAGHYQISAVVGDKAGAAFNYHPQGKGLNWRTNLYYIETPDRGAHWTNVAGQRVVAPLTQPDNACLVRDYAADGRLVYLKDIQYDATGRPAILVVTSNGHQAGPQNDPRRWELLRWDGRAWRRSIVTTSDNNYDMGSLYVDGDVWRIVAPTADGPQAYNPGGEVVAWISKDRGTTWRRERRLTAESRLNHTYVRRPVDAHDGFYALWADGHGRRPSKSRLYFSNQSGDVFRLPERMTTEFARPALLVAGKRLETSGD